mmetsp:Transcript_29185/g.45351  ORF Transcript_29185/g.45351 Transcript_29185/m.45351 type:complete len:394 (+) Transcript_29185:99-1280(+)|eukprot:CAMPEP_0196816386 /NCGR_PEP_ID=MMETSP1362-20130617/55000_1 /TAXON_ID=163516 /ORGANISM="Leptocylindrus danicus, Strain CCMP1856" /LENGTH=393 /DNA_ID=CAMNT_0042193697 /DNA_START=70 /DNA_END=1251 /DNA_ORIENTATION=+
MSRLFDDELKMPPRVLLSEIQTTEIIGKGEFGVIFALDGVNLDSRNTKIDRREENARQKLSRSCVRDANTREYPYVVKRYSPKANLYMERKNIRLKVLAIEAAVLSMVNHPNIIKLRAIADVENVLDADFFFVMDRLSCTLSDKIYVEWKKRLKKACRFKAAIFRKKNQLLEELMVDRLFVARDIASAMVYLHSRNVIYRDMKPENTGFGMDGVVKLFDFGQARDVDPDSAIEDGTYALTGVCGSRRYMAPENLLRRPYGLDVDVYSFGIMLWEMMTLKKAFLGMDGEKHRTEVAIGGVRPDIPESLPSKVKSLLNECWSQDHRKRPSFSNVLLCLSGELQSDKYSNVTREKIDKSNAQTTRMNSTSSSSGVSINDGGINSSGSSSLDTFSSM